MSATGAATRAAAARAVTAVRRDGRSLDAALAAAEAQVASTERSLLRLLAYGSLRHWWRLADRAARRLDRPLRSRDQVVHALLVIGLYQLAETRIPPHAAVDLTVRAARRLRRPQLAGLVNAVLRAELRDVVNGRDGAEAGEGRSEPACFDHPQWLIDRIRADWPTDWRSILAANNRRAPMWLRINAQRSDADRYAARLPDGARRLEGLPQALALPQPLDVAELPGFREGDVSVQDGAAQLAAHWLLENGGLHIADLCAAPGGKTAHLLELSGPETTLTAVESDKDRAARITETLDRLGLTATLRLADASEPESWWSGVAFDRVLLDAPCSASGVIRRHPDIKHLRRSSDLKTLAELQAGLLQAGWRVLARGGRLLYVTCSVFRSENDAVVGAFLSRNPDARENNVLPNNNIHALMKRTSHGFQILPGTEDLDGFFYACLDKQP